MQQMLAARGARYVHVLQPNQYFTTRPFAPGEAEVALAADSPFKPGAEQGYPALERVVASGALAEAGVTFVDGVHLFDAERAPVYIDNCCHYTRRGYEILADAIAEPQGGLKTALYRHHEYACRGRSSDRPGPPEGGPHDSIRRERGRRPSSGGCSALSNR